MTSKFVYCSTFYIPNREASGLDEVKAEMLKVDVEGATDLIFQLWAACGGCENLLVAWLKALLIPLHKKDGLEDPKYSGRHHCWAKSAKWLSPQSIICSDKI